MDKAKILSSNVTNDTEQNMLKTLFENARSDGGYIGKQNFEDETADGLDISGCDFENVLFRRCKFSRCDFERASFCNTKFDGCDFANCNFENSYWKRPEFRTAKETAEISAAAALKNASGRTVPSVMRIFPGPCSKVRMSGTANFAKRFCLKSSSG